VDSQKHVNDTFQNLWVHNFPDQNFVDPQIFKITLVDPQKIKRLSFFKKNKENRGELSQFFFEV
jgi:hypothetical protein